MTTNDDRDREEAKIRAMLADRTAALRAKNAAGVLAHHAPDFVQYSLAPPLVSSSAATDDLEAWFATWPGPIGYEIRDLDIELGGDVAWGYGLAHMYGTKNDGENVELWFRLTLCFRKTGDDWKIVHEHESVPFYMDGSFKAAVDLAP